jgi:hypothetical protein
MDDLIVNILIYSNNNFTSIIMDSQELTRSPVVMDVAPS